MVFPEIGYLIAYGINDASWSVLFGVTYPRAISQPNYNIPAQVWQGGRNKGLDLIVVNSVCQDDFEGTFAAYGGIQITT